MTGTTLNEAASPWAKVWQRVQRERALIALFDFARQRRMALRVARLYAWVVFVSYAFAIALGGGPDQRAVIHGFVRAALVALSLGVGAPAALAAARALAEPSENGVLAALALQRGVSPVAFSRARTWATARRIARLIVIPALLLVGLGVARGGSLAWALAVVPAVAAYGGALGLCLSLLALFAAELAPRHPRALLAALLLAPLLLSQVFPTLPNLFQLFSGLLDRLLEPGARLS